MLLVEQNKFLFTPGLLRFKLQSTEVWRELDCMELSKMS